jgi:hypothetical protein
MTTPITSPQATEQRRALVELGLEDILIVVVIKSGTKPSSS